jgi:cystathionine gamma-synthase
VSRASRRPATLAARAGLERDPEHGAVIPPLHLTSTFTFRGLDEPRRYDYTRSGNPTRDLLAEALADLEGGCGGVITASGMAAVAAVLHLVPAGGRVVAPADAYGGTHRLLSALARRGALELDLVDAWSPASLERALLDGADLLWLETPSNPLLRVTDLAHACRVGRLAGALVAVDNTFLSPALQRPLEWGADLVVHSTTKYLNGHSDVVGGAVVARDRARLEEVAWWANALGVTGSPFDAHQTLRGLRTLHARMRVHLENAAAVADVAAGHPAVEAVHWPGLASHPGFEVAERQQEGPGAVITLALRGGRAAVAAFLSGLECFSLAESLGGVESLVSHPCTMTHAAMPPAARERAGIGEGLLRLSVGIEAAADLVDDVARGLDRAERVGRARAPAAVAR